MAIYLDNGDVKELVDISDAVRAVEAGLLSQGLGRAVNEPRHRLKTENSGMQILLGGDDSKDILGFKSAFYAGGSVNVFLYDTKIKKLVAVIEAGLLGAMRTGAASAVATKYMARPNSSSLGIIGTGSQAITQVQAICSEFKIDTILVYSRDKNNRAKFADYMKRTMQGSKVVVVDSANEAAKADIVTTATRSEVPVLEGKWLEKGTHINAIGSNSIIKREIDLEVVRRSDLIVIDDRVQGAIECGDLLEAWEIGLVDRNRMLELGDVVSSKNKLRNSADDITLFESQGIGLWDISFAKTIYDLAIEKGKGVGLPF
jgi:ornithine cyclodeaminase/alanine dehydrogenase-like protein (mu-crystallin family)